MVVKVVEIQRVVISSGGEVLIYCHGEDGKVRFKVESLGDASDELV